MKLVLKMLEKLQTIHLLLQKGTLSAQVEKTCWTDPQRNFKCIEANKNQSFLPSPNLVSLLAETQGKYEQKIFISETGHEAVSDI